MAGTLVILGGCGCIGRALVSSALEADYTPVVLDLRASIAAHQMSVPCLPVDASEPKSLRSAAAKLDDGLAGFVNLCGFMTAPTPVMDQTTNTWRHVIDGNLNAAFYAAQAIAPKLRTGAAMVLTGSGLGHYARPGFGPYAISKAGIAALTRQLAMEMAPNIRVNCVAPSAVDTVFLRGGTGRSAEAEDAPIDVDRYAAAIPLGRIARADDVSGPILFLLSDAAAYITGQPLHVNGGGYLP